MKIIVTGGASGLGAAITDKLVSSGEHEVWFTWCRSEKAAEELQKKWKNAHGIRCDFSDAGQVNELAQQFENITPDVLVNNAVATGIHREHFHKTAPEIFMDGFRTNVMPVIQLTQAAINVFRKKKQGSIITVLSSALINKPPIGWSEYVASKSYLLSMSKSWAVENAKFNITSNSISPSFMLTDMHAGMDERVIEEMIKNHPLKRLLEPHEVADAVAYLVSAGAQVNGLNFVINAGDNLA